MRKMTKHGKKRIYERSKKSFNERTVLKTVLKNGKTKEFFYGDFFEYLYNKSLRGAKVKVYKDMIYILSNHSHNLITVYPVPEEYIPTNRYLLTQKQMDIFHYTKKFLNKEIVIFTNNEIIKGLLLKIDRDKITTVLYVKDFDNNLIEISTEDIIEIKYDFSNVEQFFLKKIV